MNDEMVSTDSEIVEVLNNEFKSVFITEDGYFTIAATTDRNIRNSMIDWKCKQGTCDEVYKKNQTKQGRGTR